MSKMSGEVDVSRLLLACICSATKSGTSSATCALLSWAWLIALLLPFALASVSSSVFSVAGSVALSAASAASRAAISALEGRPLLRLGGAIIASGWASSSAFSGVCFFAGAASSASLSALLAGVRFVENMWSASFLLTMRVRRLTGVSLPAVCSACASSMS